MAGSPGVSRANAWTTGLTHSAGAGPNRALIFVVGYEHDFSDPGVSSVSYGGQQMSRIAGGVAGTTAYARVELWRLAETGLQSAGGSTFAVTWGGAAPSQPMYAAATYQNVDQASPVSDSSSNSSNSSSPNPITTALDIADDGMAVAGAIAGAGGSYAWATGWTEGSDQTSGSTTTMSSADWAAGATPTPTPAPTPSGDLLSIGPGGTIVLNATANVSVSKVAQSGSYDQLVGISSPINLSLLACKSSATGFSAAAGALGAGEIVLRLTTPQSTYFSGPPSRNPDGVLHAQLQKLSPTVVRVSWEDLFGGGDQDYNDCVVDVTAATP